MCVKPAADLSRQPPPSTYDAHTLGVFVALRKAVESLQDDRLGRFPKHLEVV